MGRLLIIPILFLSISYQIHAQNPSVATIEEARKAVKTLFEEENIVGLAITVSFADSIIWSEGFGYSDLNSEKAIEPDKTLFRIASLSKPITATILGRLYEEKVIDLEESVYTYVPNFPKKEFDINLQQLATHRSGIRHYKSLEKENRMPLTIEEGLAKFQKSKLNFEPGTNYLYSSYGYNLLGVAMEKASKKAFEQLLQTYVTVPLNMTNTLADKGVYDNIQTSGFFESNKKGKITEAQDVNLYMKLPSGGMLSTSEDLVKFGNAYFDERLLQETTKELMLTDTPLPSGKKTGYGIGWGVKVDKKGNKTISHTGGNTGAVCRLIVCPESKLTIAVVSNTFGIDWLKFIRTVNSLPNIILNEMN